MAASFVRPGFKVVIPTFSEVIIQQDGFTKNDCERNAAKRYYEKFRQEHPHLKVIVVEDGLSSNGPHIPDLQKHNLRFILGAKPGDHGPLFTQLKQAAEDGIATDIDFLDPDDDLKSGECITYSFNFTADLGPGSYSVTIALHSSNGYDSSKYEWKDFALTFNVVNLNSAKFEGKAWLPSNVVIER